MLDVLAVTVPVFLVIAAGFAAARARLMEAAQVDALMTFTQRFAIPALLFLAMARLDLSEGFDLRLLGTYYSGSLVTFGAGAAGAILWLKRGREDAVAVGFAAMFANTVLLGLPIAERAYGTESLAPNYAIIALHAAFCYLVGITAMEAARGGGAGLGAKLWGVVRRMASNGLMIGVALGLAVNLSGLPLPGAVEEATVLVSRAALPAALFALGGVLTRYRPEGDARGIALVCGVSLLVHPAWAFGVGTAIGLEPGPLRAAVLTAAMAPGVNAYLYAAAEGRAVRISASSVLLGTALCTLTVPLWLLLLG